jgi:hypothetical protein
MLVNLGAENALDLFTPVDWMNNPGIGFLFFWPAA